MAKLYQSNQIHHNLSLFFPIISSLFFFSTNRDWLMCCCCQLKLRDRREKQSPASFPDSRSKRKIGECPRFEHWICRRRLLFSFWIYGYYFPFLFYSFSILFVWIVFVAAFVCCLLLFLLRVNRLCKISSFACDIYLSVSIFSNLFRRDWPQND